MNLILFDTPETRFTIEESASAASLGLDEEPFSGNETLSVTCSCHRDGDVAVAECMVTVPVVQVCARCLADGSSTVSTAFTLVVRRLHQGEHPPEESEDEDTFERDEDVRFLPHDQHMVAIGDLVHDAVLLAVPDKPLCSEECRGLCPECGGNLNETECGCTSEHHDPRWRGLENLFDENG